MCDGCWLWYCEKRSSGEKVSKENDILGEEFIGVSGSCTCRTSMQIGSMEKNLGGKKCESMI